MSSEVIKQIKQAIRHDEFEVDGDHVQMVIDRYRRHDHGAGDNGDDWLPEHEIAADYEKGVEAHKTKLRQVNNLLEAAGYKPTARFDLGEKGHFSIYFKLKKIG